MNYLMLSNVKQSREHVFFKSTGTLGVFLEVEFDGKQRKVYEGSNKVQSFKRTVS